MTFPMLLLASTLPRPGQLVEVLVFKTRDPVRADHTTAAGTLFIVETPTAKGCFCSCGKVSPDWFFLAVAKLKYFRSSCHTDVVHSSFSGLRGVANGLRESLK